MTDLKRKIILRTLYVLMVLFFSGAIYFFYTAWEKEKRLEQFQKEIPVNMDIDLSKPGSYKGKFQQEFSNSHGQVLNLKIPLSDLKKCENSILEKLQATIMITDDTGKKLFDDECIPIIAQSYNLNDDEIALFRFAPMKRGTYFITLSVEQPIPELAGVEQKLINRYNFCGLEFMAAFVIKVIAGAFFVVFLILGAIVVAMRKRKKQDQLTEIRE